jgi:hypothetical protein
MHAKEVGLMLVLGVTADDKGAQLERLIRTVLTQQGYTKVRSNVVGTGGNELDVVAVRESPVMGGVQLTPLVCEAKAYADPITMPVWQRFLGKVFIERAKDATAVGMLVALNGVNGNVAGSFDALSRQDTALFLFEGTDLTALAATVNEVGHEQPVRAVVLAQFGKAPPRMEIAYYGGAYYWVVWWKDDSYSVVDGHGRMLPTDDVEKLRDALQATLPGELLATEEARAAAERRHRARLKVLNRLFRGEEVPWIPTTEDTEESAAEASLAAEPYTREENGRLSLAPPGDLDAAGVARLFTSIFEDTVKISHLSFMVGRHHAPYIDRLVELLPELHAGFTLTAEDSATLREVAVPFPSAWLAIASPNPMVSPHQADPPLPDTDEQDQVLSTDVASDQQTAGVKLKEARADEEEAAEAQPAEEAASFEAQAAEESMLASRRTSFWERVIAAIRSDYANPRLRGFLYDYMDVAEIEERGEFVVKSKSGPVGLPIRTELRNAVRRYSDETISDETPVYIMVRILPGISEPWDQEHPAPGFPLEEDCCPTESGN